MDQHSVQVIIETLKEEGVDLAVTLPEEPTFALTEAMRQDPFFQAVTVAGEGNGLAFCAGAALGGRGCVFVTGIAGLLAGAWALANMGPIYGAPFTIIASYRGDFGDNTRVAGDWLHMFKQMGEPLLNTLQIPYQVVDRKDAIEPAIRRANFACRDYETPVALLFTGDVLW